MTAPPRITGLFVYPIKGCRGIPLTTATLGPMGLAHDRRWMVVDAGSGRFLTQRERPQLARVAATIDGDVLLVEIPGAAALTLPPGSAGESLRVIVWRDEVAALAPSAAADAALSAFLGRAVRLVRFDERERRGCDPDHAPPGAHTGFADGFPLLVTSEGSLAELDDALAEAGHPPVPMRRFRPNVVVGGVPTRAEDAHKALHVGDLVVDLVKPCDRCIVTTTDQDTGERAGDEPLRTLKHIRRNPRTGGVWFGQNGVPRLRDGETVRLAVGDPVTFTGVRAA
jgi:hypothetical protein